MRTEEKKYNFNFIVGSVITGVIVILVLIGFFYTPYDPNGMNASLKNMGPSFWHPFGTDNFGRDILSRVMQGAGTTFIIAITTVVIGAFFGTILGAVTGYFGGWLDEILMRMNDGLASFPSILLALVFVSIFGTGTYNIVLALGIIFIPSFARVVRSEFILLKELDFVKNAKLMGAGKLRIMFVHILPNTKPILMSSIMIGFNNAVLAEAGMSYLGLGVQPPQASLGRMLSEAQAFLFNAPWYAIAPGLMIVFTVLGVSLMSGGRADDK
jgi:peptide/nickel transport system permease protein